MSYHVDPADWGERTLPRPARGMHYQFPPAKRDPHAPLTVLLSAGEQAACKFDSEPDRWFGNQGRKTDEDLAAMRRLCAHCPLRTDCLAYALAHDVRGFWAGTTSGQRARLRTARGVTAERLPTAGPYGGGGR